MERLSWSCSAIYPAVDAGLAASIFHTKQVEIGALKQYLRSNDIEMRV